MGYTSLPRVYRKLLRSSRRNGADCEKNEDGVYPKVSHSTLCWLVSWRIRGLGVLFSVEEPYKTR
jgi:hypothetical protein